MSEKDPLPKSPSSAVIQAPLTVPPRDDVATVAVEAPADPPPIPHIAALSWKTNPRTLFRAMMGLTDSAHHIALGAAIGMFVGLTPTVGMQMAFVMIFAVLSRRFFYFNRIAALIMVYISNPITTIPMYYAEYKLGQLFVRTEPVEYERFEKLLKPSGLSFFEWWQVDVWPLLVDIAIPLFTGSAILAVGFGLLTYPLILKLVRGFRGEKAHDEVPQLPGKSTQSKPDIVVPPLMSKPTVPSSAAGVATKPTGGHTPHSSSGGK